MNLVPCLIEMTTVRMIHSELNSLFCVFRNVCHLPKCEQANPANSQITYSCVWFVAAF